MYDSEGTCGLRVWLAQSGPPGGRPVAVAVAVAPSCWPGERKGGVGSREQQSECRWSSK